MSGRVYRVGVIGGGAWGTALSIVVNRAGSQTSLITRNQNIIQSVEEHRSNDIYLPGAFLDPSINVTDKIADACNGDIVIIAVPSHVLRSACISISDMLPTTVPIVIASKGIERGSLLLMSEVVHSILPRNPIAVLSGPNFAEEAAKGLPTATTIACANHKLWEMLTSAIGGKLFRPYMSEDVIGTQIGGAVKNVIAIACGIAIGKEFGENARAALVTRGFAETARLALTKGAKPETLMGLSGLGDMILTCSSRKSRNLSFGIAVGKGESQQDVLTRRGRTAIEGFVAAESVNKLAKKAGVSMPICDAVHRILYEDAPVEQVIQELLERPFVSE